LIDSLLIFPQLFFIELLAIILVNLLHAEPYSILKNLNDLDPYEESFFYDFSYVLCLLLPYVAGMDNRWFVVDDVENMNETAELVHF